MIPTFTEFLDILEEKHKHKGFENKGTYVAVKVINNKELTEWFSNQGLTIEDPSDLHITIAYSSKYFKHKINEDNIIIPKNDVLGFDLFGDDEDILVMTLKSKELSNRHKLTDEEGAYYDYPVYQPHITLSYNFKPTKRTKLSEYFKLPNFDIVLGNEYVEDLDPAKGN
jgi:hypothetical protein